MATKQELEAQIKELKAYTDQQIGELAGMINRRFDEGIDLLDTYHSAKGIQVLKIGVGSTPKRTGASFRAFSDHEKDILVGPSNVFEI